MKGWLSSEGCVLLLQSLVPSPHTRGSQLPTTPAPGNSMPLTSIKYLHLHVHTHKHIIKHKSFFLKTEEKKKEKKQKKTMVYGETKYWGLYNYVSFLGPHFSSLVSVFLVMVAKLRALNMLKHTLAIVKSRLPMCCQWRYKFNVIGASQ